MGGYGEKMSIKDVDEDYYGLILTQARNVIQFSEQVLDENDSQPYNVVLLILGAFAITIIIVLIVFGNVLVIHAVTSNKSLKTFQNMLISSLAVTDLCIGIFVMPFSLVNHVSSYWSFGHYWCEIYGALDVFLCTSSILIICLISIDRYRSIVSPINCQERNLSMFLVHICSVVIYSALVSTPPLLGWKENKEKDWFDNILTRNNGNLTQLKFLEELQDQLGEKEFRQFVDLIIDKVFPTCKVSNERFHSLVIENYVTRFIIPQF